MRCVRHFFQCGKVIRKIDNDKILFIPDCNLGDYVSRQVPDKTFKLLSGGCPTHARLTARDVQAAKAKHPQALFWCTRSACLPLWNRRIM